MFKFSLKQSSIACFCSIVCEMLGKGKGVRGICIVAVLYAVNAVSLSAPPPHPTLQHVISTVGERGRTHKNGNISESGSIAQKSFPRSPLHTCRVVGPKGLLYKAVNVFIQNLTAAAIEIILKRGNIFQYTLNNCLFYVNEP